MLPIIYLMRCDAHVNIIRSTNFSFPPCRPDPWFSSFYILFGAGLIAAILTKAGQQIEETASTTVYDALKRREMYEEKMARNNPIFTRLRAFIGYNLGFFISILIWLMWVIFIIVWSMQATKGENFDIEGLGWDFSHAQYFAISLCSSAGSFSLPYGSPDWAYLLAAISMMIGVPLMALAVSSIVIMLWQGYRFKKVSMAAWSPVTINELETLNALGLGSTCGDDEQMSKGEFVMLGLLRMGQDAGVIKYFADAYEEYERRGGVAIDKSSVGNAAYSDQARLYLGQRLDSISYDEEHALPGNGKQNGARKEKRTSRVTFDDTAHRLKSTPPREKDRWSVVASSDELRSQSSQQLSDFSLRSTLMGSRCSELSNFSATRSQGPPNEMASMEAIAEADAVSQGGTAINISNDKATTGDSDAGEQCHDDEST